MNANLYMNKKRVATAAVLSVSCIGGLIALTPALFMAPRASAAAQKAHQYPWSPWIQTDDGHSNGVYLRFRKGDNSFHDKPNIFYQVNNRYNKKAQGEITFDVVNINTGTSRPSAAYFDQGPETQRGDDDGSWCPIPDAPTGVKQWDGLRVELRNVRMKVLRLPDPDGNMRQVYPIDELAAHERKKAEEKKRKEEEARKKEEEARKKQEVQKKVNQDKQAQETRQQAEQARQAEASQKAEEQRKTQAVLNKSNQVMQDLQNQFKQNADATAQLSKRQKNSEEDSKRRKEEIENRFRNLDDDPKIESLQSDLEVVLLSAESAQASQENGEAEVERYQQLADSEGNATIAAIHRLGQIRAQSQVDKAKREKEKYQSQAKRIEREIQQERRRRVSEKEAALKKAAASEAEEALVTREVASRQSESTRSTMIEENVESGGRKSSIDLGNALYLQKLGSALYNQGKYSESEPFYREAVSIDPKNASNQINLGNALYMQKKYAESGPFYREAVKMDPKNAALQRDLGSALYNQGKYSESEPFYREAVSIDPKNASNQINLGNALYMQKKYAESEPFYREAVKMDPKNAVFRNSLGDVFRSQSKWADAVIAYREAVRLHPANTVYQNNLAHAIQKNTPKPLVPKA